MADMTGSGGSDFFRPVSGFDLPRFAGIPTFMRLPHVGLDDPRLAEVQIGLIGAPWDGGTTNRPGPRHGPRQLRDASTMMRAQNGLTGVRPFERVRCADLGQRYDTLRHNFNDALTRLEEAMSRVNLKGNDIAPFDCGAVINALVNAAWSRGLGCVINSQGIMQSPVVREHAGIPDDQVIMICVAMGWPDEDFPANAVVSNRKSVADAARFVGFED